MPSGTPKSAYLAAAAVTQLAFTFIFLVVPKERPLLLRHEDSLVCQHYQSRPAILPLLVPQKPNMFRP
jgi:hypothetical protein